MEDLSKVLIFGIDGLQLSQVIPGKMPNPMERNPMQFNPMSNFGLLGPRPLNMPRALPTSDELN